MRILIFTMGVMLLAFSLFLPHALAHENYVLPKTDIQRGMADWSINVWGALRNPESVLLGIKVGIGILIVFILYFFFERSRWGTIFVRKIKRLEPVAETLVRFAVGVSFIYSAATDVFLGPEIPLSSIPGGEIWRWILYVAGVMLALGLFSRVAGAISMLIIILATIIYRGYMLTYFNYFGEFAALILFGSYVFSIDRLLAAKKFVVEKIKDYESAILRVTYGISVLYPAITIKLLHPVIMIEIVNKYHLDRIHWLFPSDPLLISLGTGLTQILIGALIIMGFETRLCSFGTLMLYIMSILYFKEAVWPHYVLLALAFYLVVNGGGKLGLDAKLLRRK